MTSRFDYIKVGIASPDRILSWSRGEVTKPETINYRTLKPERDGLFCERIFGPAKDWECHCGKYKRVRHKGIICERCGVEVTDSKVRRYRMGHIKLAAPVAHIWYLKGIPSYMSILLDIPLRALEDVVYFNSYIVLDPGNTNLEKKQTISEEEFETISANPEAEFRAEMGAQAIKQLLEEMDTATLSQELRNEIATTTGQKKAKAIKRLRVVDALSEARSLPNWMILDAVPVIPPDLRPMVQLDGGRFATSDLNDLYRRVINRNNRLYRLNEMGAPDIIIRNEMRMLQEAVDALIDNGRRGRAVVGPNNRPLKSLSDIIEGKQGRFRQNLLGKRVDYSGRSVIVVGPYLKLHQCGLPKEMALELFKPFVMNKLVDRGIVQNIKSAKKKIERGETIVWDILEEVIKSHPVMLNRAPTLHRLGIQAFEPVLVEGRAIQIHPLVCTAFNADFDGDQMAVHVPLSVEAQTEARLLMLASNNVLSPATGRPIITPTQDMVLGVYYLTVDNPAAQDGEVKFFKDFTDVHAAYSQGLIKLHTKVAVRFQGDRIENLTPDYFERFTTEQREYLQKQVASKQLLLTTPGRIILNENLPESFPFYNKIVDRKELERIIMRAFQTIGSSDAAELADSLKNLGFRYATKSGISIAISDLHVPDQKKDILRRAEDDIEQSRRAYLRGEITEVERYSKVIDTWAETTNELTDLIKEKYDRLNSVYMMAFSGARGNISQVRQLVGMRGLMADPSGRIIDQPIKSNFAEGLTVTEYIISSYGARKGLVDTALRTADSGYLTRRLADVAQDVIVSEEDCGTDQHYHLSAIKDGDVVVIPLTDRAIGRVLSENLVNTGTGEVLLEAGTLITPENVAKIMEAGVDTISIRSPLSCKTKHGVCRKCYGWSLTNNQLVDIGEAVGIIAAQSIGEPGTQLTMRTFHTGGVFTKSSTTQLIKAKQGGTIALPEDFSTREFRTRHGNIINITDHEVTIQVKGAKKAQSLTVPIGFEVKVKDGETVAAGAVLAESFLETGRTTRKSIEKGYKDISSDASGSLEFVGFHPEEKRDRQGNITKTANRSGVIWVLAGDVYTLPAGAEVKVETNQKVKEKDVLAETRLVSEYGGVIRLGEDVTYDTIEDGRVMIHSGREINVVTADLRFQDCEVLPGKKDPILQLADSAFALKVREGARIETDMVIAEAIDENFL
ncbi:MAG: DNA-directed RNA polymerase subunit beta', partial [Bacteroidota bacterium]